MPSVTRRQFLKISAAGLGASGLAVMGFSPSEALAEVRKYKLAKTNETRSMCPYCSVSCGLIVYSKPDGDGKRASRRSSISRAIPDNPVNRGTLCPKGAGLLDMVHSPKRTLYPEYRAPGSNEWKRLSWDDAYTRIAKLVKDDRDKNFIAKKRRRRCRESLVEHRAAREQRGDQRGRLSHIQGRPRPWHGGDRHPGAHLTRPDGGQSGPDVWTWCDDQSLGRHQECRCHPDHGRQCRRGPSLRIQVGDGGQGETRRQARRRGPALYALGRGGGLLRAAARGHGHCFPGRCHELPARQQQVPRRVCAQVHGRDLPGQSGVRFQRRLLLGLGRAEEKVRQGHLGLPEGRRRFRRGRRDA